MIYTEYRIFCIYQILYTIKHYFLFHDFFFNHLKRNFSSKGIYSHIKERRGIPEREFVDYYLPTQFREKEIRIKKVKCRTQYMHIVSCKTESGIGLLIHGLVYYPLLGEQKDRGHFYAEKNK